MGFAPSECVVIEDSVTGVTAAVNAEMEVYGIINNLFSEEQLRHAGAIPFKSMNELPALLEL
jgi:beta-phosphoglucomutase-like phosphatase (HAD superfamily)